MTVFFIVVALVVAAAAAFDGHTTVGFLARGYEEHGTAWLFGRRPTALVVYGRGAVVVAAELVVAYYARRNVVLGTIVLLTLLAQAVFHVRAGIGNRRLR